MQCQQCQAQNDADLRFCESCGAKLARSCSSCGHELKPEARFCGKCGAPVSALPAASAAAPPPSATVIAAPTEAGERRQLTALFSDLVGSTEIASQLDPEDWHGISKEYQKVAAAAVTRFGGHVDKFLGDGLTCAQGGGYFERSVLTNWATAAPISSGLSSWTKCDPLTVVSVRLDHDRMSAPIRPPWMIIPGVALMKSFGTSLWLNQSL